MKILQAIGEHASNRILNNALAALQAGDYERALIAFHTALRMDRFCDRKPSMLNCLMGISHIHSIRGEHDLALSHLQEASSLCEGLQDFEMQIMCLGKIGEILQSRGDYAEALNLFRQALAVARVKMQDDGIAQCLRHIGKLYQKQGNNEQAVQHLREAMLIFQRVRNPDGAGDCMLILARLQRRERDGRSLELAMTALDSLYTTKNPKGIASALHLIGEIYHDQGDSDKALDFCRQALSIDERNGQSVAAVCTTMSIIEVGRRNYAQAQEYSTRAIQSLRQADEDRIGLGRCLRNHGILCLHLGIDKYDQAIQHLMESISIFEGLKVPEELAESLINLGQVYLEQKELVKARQVFTEAIRLQEALRMTTAGQIVHRRVAEARLLDGHYFLIEGVLWNSGQFAEALRHVEQTKTRGLLHILDRQGGRSSSRTGVIGEDVQNLPVSATVAADCTADKATAMIVLFQGFKQTLAFVISESGTIGVHLPECNITKTRQIGERWLSTYVEFRKHKHSAAKKRQWMDCMEDALAELYSLVFAPIRPVLGSDVTKLVFVPHLWLHYFPFHAMYHTIDGQKRYLIEEYEEISYAPSLSIFRECKKRPRKRLDRFVAIQNPTSDLPEADQQVSEIAPLFREPVVLGPNQQVSSSRANIVGETKAANVVLCTGHSVGGDPETAHLDLGGGERFGLLDQLAELDLPNCSLWDADTCESGFSMVSLSDDWLTLAGVPLFVGAATVWSTLWAVEDRASRIVKRAAYKNLVRRGLNKVLSLNDAQRQFLRSCRAECTGGESPYASDLGAREEHPFYWAGYTAAGAQ